MTDPIIRLADDADALRSAAQGLHADAVDPACAQLAPVAFEAIEDALTTFSRTCYAVARAFVPLGDNSESIADRYSRAATNWPSPRNGTGPSREQLARVLTSLHDAGSALRAAAGQCTRAAADLAATMEPADDGRPFMRATWPLPVQCRPAQPEVDTPSSATRRWHTLRANASHRPVG